MVYEDGNLTRTSLRIFEVRATGPHLHKNLIRVNNPNYNRYFCAEYSRVDATNEGCFIASDMCSNNTVIFAYVQHPVSQCVNILVRFLKAEVCYKQVRKLSVRKCASLNALL